MKILIDRGADVNARLKMKVWYPGYNFDLAGVDEIGATPFWRAAYASDVEAMKMLVADGADPNMPTIAPAGRPHTGDGTKMQDIRACRRCRWAARCHAAPGGVGCRLRRRVRRQFASLRAGRHAAGGEVPHRGARRRRQRRDHEGNTPLHHAASRGDVEMILYLVSKGADVKAVNREGQTTADMANGPVQRTQPYPEALALLEAGREEQQQVRLMLRTA